MQELVGNLEAEASRQIDALYGQGTDEANDARYYHFSRINTMRKGDVTSDYVGRPDIQWGIIIDELEAELRINAGYQALNGTNTYLYLVEDVTGTLVEEDLVKAV